MAGGQQLPEQYTVPQLARVFHSLPHLNVSLHSVNNTFNPHSEIYLESLGILGSIPAAWLILTLLVLLVYLVTRCCDRKPRPRRSITLLKCSLAILALLCSGAVAVGLYGNDDVHNGLVQLVAAAKNVDGILMGIRNQTDTIEATLKGKVQPQLTALRDEFDDPVSNKTMLDQLLIAMQNMKQNTSTAVNQSFEIRKPLSGISLAGAIGMGEKIEQLRWPVTMAVLSALLVLCVVLVVGVARHSRCVLITFSVFGLFAVIVSWLMASLYLATSVALGDLCVSPDGYLTRAVPSTLTSEVLSYYTHCENTRINSFTQRLRDGQTAVSDMRENLNTVTRLALELFQKQQLQPKLNSLSMDVNTVNKLMSGLATLLDCKPLHKQYVHAAKSLCHLGLYGLTFMLLASLAAGLFFTVLVWVDSHTWIYIRKRRDYHQVDEQDPYLPPSAASQAIAARTLRGQGSYPPTAPSVFYPNAHGTQNTIKQPLLLTPPPPSYATATARARQLHESMLKGGGINGSGGGGDHKSSQHNQQSTGGRAEHRSGLGDQPGQYATLSKQCKTLESSREPPWTPSVASFTGTLSHNSHGPAHLATFQDSRKTQTLDPKNLANLKRGPTPAWNQSRPLPPNPSSQPTWEFESRSQTNMNHFRSLVRNKAPNIRIQDQMQDQVRTLDRNFTRNQFNGTTQNNAVPNMYGTYNRAQSRQENKTTVATLSQVQGSDPNLYAVTEL
ncbi:PREDICTED: protein tweety isoform X1 [Habropoda laboriosa]|uniref:protein tweety isoform X1 n=1 Tax=Habropoda laboriosa TaxID=597456 RepID=UPI00083D2B94|nr:PREDICTED: protein tweety isoform X1 [Habropoda laboriosa]